MGINLYHFAPSPPARAALLAARAVGIDVELKIIDLFKKEQLSSPELLKVSYEMDYSVDVMHSAVIFFPNWLLFTRRSILNIRYRL